MKKPIYSDPIFVEDIRDCHFYHSIELPGYGLIQGEWDLRSGVDEYLGNFDFHGKRVLEIGTAGGFLCFEMEKRGAELIAYDLSPNDDWDIVPYDGNVPLEERQNRQDLIRKVNNAWWFSHRLLQSKAKMVYGNIYQIPAEIGSVQVTTFGSVLLHVRDPFLALQRSASLTNETIIVTEATPIFWRSGVFWPLRLLSRVNRRIATYMTPALDFLPDPDTHQPWDTWWNLSPELIRRFLKILGFTKTRTTFHEHAYFFDQQPSRKRLRKLFTVVGSRP
jgi:hypothetical protein